jgi:uncharacterized MAPEG superfamily protein
MAQTKKKRRRKHKGTQGGKIDTRRRTARPRNRAEAKQRAMSQRKKGGTKRQDRAPTWRGAVNRAALGAVIVAVVMSILTKNVAQGVILGALMLLIYIPLGYMLDTAMWRRRERQRIRANQKDG